MRSYFNNPLCRPLPSRHRCLSHSLQVGVVRLHHSGFHLSLLCDCAFLQPTLTAREPCSWPLPCPSGLFIDSCLLDAAFVHDSESVLSFDCLLTTYPTHSCLTSHPVLIFTCSCTVYRGPAWLGWFAPVALAFVNERDTAGVLPDAFLP